MANKKKAAPKRQRMTREKYRALEKEFAALGEANLELMELLQTRDTTARDLRDKSHAFEHNFHDVSKERDELKEEIRLLTLEKYKLQGYVARVREVETAHHGGVECEQASCIDSGDVPHGYNERKYR